MKYRKKPVVIDAKQWFGGSNIDIGRFLGYTSWTYFEATNTEPEHLTIKTLKGDHIVSLGDWIIKGGKGEFYPCKPDIFEQTYERVEE
jgi:hypothetical protein